MLTFTDIHEAVLLCEAVYRPDYEAEADARALGYTEVQHLGNGGPHCMVVSSAQRMVIVFRGTQWADLQDVIADGRILPRRSSFGGLCHRGFMEHIDSLNVELGRAVLRCGSRHLIICGHSLGGAAAIHAAARAGLLRKIHGQSLPHLVTVGSPLVGTRKFRHAVEANTCSIYRITNNRDPITMVPLWPLYGHPVGHRMHIDSNGELHQQPEASELIAARAGALWKFTRRLVSHWSVLRAIISALNHRDHKIANYREAFDHAKITMLELEEYRRGADCEFLDQPSGLLRSRRGWRGIARDEKLRRHGR